jgi:hypothetical protein
MASDMAENYRQRHSHLFSETDHMVRKRTGWPCVGSARRGTALPVLVPQEADGYEIHMALTVKSLLDVEMIRDGGSLAATFCDEVGSKWILLLEIDQISHESEVETLGFKKPVLIDADPAKRPMDTEGRIYSALSGPAYSLTWEEAEALVGQITELATLAERAARYLNQFRIAIDSRGGLPPDMARFSPIGRF